MREGMFRNISGCAISGIFSKSGRRFSGERIINSIAVMHERSNGLGEGFTAYGIYPEYKDYFAFHIFYDNRLAKEECGDFLEEHFDSPPKSRTKTRSHIFSPAFHIFLSNAPVISSPAAAINLSLRHCLLTV